MRDLEKRNKKICHHLLLFLTAPTDDEAEKERVEYRENSHFLTSFASEYKKISAREEAQAHGLSSDQRFLAHVNVSMEGSDEHDFNKQAS